MNEAERFLRNYQRQEQQPPASLQTFSEPQGNFQGMPQDFGVSAVPVQRMVGFGEAWKRFWTRWTFQGRSSRSEYWFAVLANVLLSFLIGFLLGFVLALLFGNAGTSLAVMAGGIIDLVIVVPGICLFVRRLHDAGLSGWWFWLSLIPYVGCIPLLVFACLPSEMRENRYGPIPNLK